MREREERGERREKTQKRREERGERRREKEERGDRENPHSVFFDTELITHYIAALCMQLSCKSGPVSNYYKG